MTDLPTTIEAEIAKELVKAMVGGLANLVKKVPALFGRGRAKQELVAAEVDRSAALLTSAVGKDLNREQIRQEAAWEVVLRELLAERPDALGELQAIVAEIHKARPATPERTVYQQRVESGGVGAQGPGASATVNHNYPTGTVASAVSQIEDS